MNKMHSFKIWKFKYVLFFFRHIGYVCIYCGILSSIIIQVFGIKNGGSQLLYDEIIIMSELY